MLSSARPTNVLEMMKEWKNNPESDEENMADEKNNWSIQEKFKGYQSSGPSGNVQDNSSTSDEEEEKQVGGTNKARRETNCFIFPNYKIPSQHLEVIATLQFLHLCLFCWWFVSKEGPTQQSK